MQEENLKVHVLKFFHTKLEEAEVYSRELKRRKREKQQEEEQLTPTSSTLFFREWWINYRKKILQQNIKELDDELITAETNIKHYKTKIEEFLATGISISVSGLTYNPISSFIYTFSKPSSSAKVDYNDSTGVLKLVVPKEKKIKSKKIEEIENTPISENLNVNDNFDIELPDIILEEEKIEKIEKKKEEKDEENPELPEQFITLDYKDNILDVTLPQDLPDHLSDSLYKTLHAIIQSTPHYKKIIISRKDLGDDPSSHPLVLALLNGGVLPENIYFPCCCLKNPTRYGKDSTEEVTLADMKKSVTWFAMVQALWREDIFQHFDTISDTSGVFIRFFSLLFSILQVTIDAFPMIELLRRPLSPMFEAGKGMISARENGLLHTHTWYRMFTYTTLLTGLYATLIFLGLFGLSVTLMTISLMTIGVPIVGTIVSLLYEDKWTWPRIAVLGASLLGLPLFFVIPPLLFAQGIIAAPVVPIIVAVASFIYSTGAFFRWSWEWYACSQDIKNIKKKMTVMNDDKADEICKSAEEYLKLQKEVIKQTFNALKQHQKANGEYEKIHRIQQEIEEAINQYKKAKAAFQTSFEPYLKDDRKAYKITLLTEFIKARETLSKKLRECHYLDVYALRHNLDELDKNTQELGAFCDNPDAIKLLLSHNQKKLQAELVQKEYELSRYKLFTATYLSFSVGTGLVVTGTTLTVLGGPAGATVGSILIGVGSAFSVVGAVGLVVLTYLRLKRGGEVGESEPLNPMKREIVANEFVPKPKKTNANKLDYEKKNEGTFVELKDEESTFSSKLKEEQIPMAKIDSSSKSGFFGTFFNLFKKSSNNSEEYVKMKMDKHHKEINLGL